MKLRIALLGVLWALWLRALRRPVAAAAITLAYAATDELHQTFVAGRHGSPWDWAIDAAGVGLAVLAPDAYRSWSWTGWCCGPAGPRPPRTRPSRSISGQARARSPR